MDISRRYPGNTDRDYNFLFSHINNLKIILGGKLHWVPWTDPLFITLCSKWELMLQGNCVEQKHYRMISMVRFLTCCQLIVKKLPESYAALKWSWEFLYSLGKGGLILWLFWQRISSYPILKHSLLFWTLTRWGHQRWNMRENPIQTHSSLTKGTQITILRFSWSIFKDPSFKPGCYLRFPVSSSEYY